MTDIESSDIKGLEDSVSNFEKILVIAGVVTAIFAVITFYYKSELNNRQKKELESMKHEISISNEQSQKAIATAEEARLKQIEAERDKLKFQVELEKLRGNIAPRILTPTQKKEFIELLKVIPNESVMCYVLIGDAEAHNFMLQILSAFREANWKLQKSSDLQGVEYTGIALLIKSQSQSDFPPYAVHALNALKTIGLNPEVKIDKLNLIKTEGLTILFGHMPKPSLDKE